MSSDEAPVEPAEPTEADRHRAMAVTANNTTWDLLDGRTHTAGEADDLLERAYAAAYHWRRASGRTPLNASRASWLISRCHATLGHGELALHHAERSIAHLAEADDLAADFDLAYAHEARARALACLGRVEEADAERATAAAVPIAGDEDRSIFESDLASGPWFGLPDR